MNNLTALYRGAAMDCVIAFRDAMQSTFGLLDFMPIADGSIYRFHVQGDKAGTLNAWYILFADGIASGCYGNWKAASSHTWNSREPANPVEAEHLRQRIEQASRAAPAPTAGSRVCQSSLARRPSRRS